jgi:succinyl-diaminopimelate desuccinylase
VGNVSKIINSSEHYLMKNTGLIKTLSDLIRINSINPAYPAGRAEAEIQHYVVNFFHRHGISAQQQLVMPNRPNVIASVPGRDPSRRIVFEAHCDTAGIEGMTIPPFEPELKDGRMYGRGSCDTKAGLAALMCALIDLKRSCETPACEVWVVASVDEEHSYRGVLKLCENLRAAAAVVSEPTQLRMAVASKGCLRWSIVVQGKAAHSSKPYLGLNSITHMCRILNIFERDSERLCAKQHPLLGSPTVNVGTIQGGTQVNIVPETCSVEIDRRLIPGETPDEVFFYYKTVLEDLQSRYPEWNVTIGPPSLEDWPLETPADSAIVLRTSAVLGDAGLVPEPVGVPFGSDASKFSRAGIPSIVLGPGSIDQAHTVDEYIELEQVEQAFVVYRELMKSFE